MDDILAFMDTKLVHKEEDASFAKLLAQLLEELVEEHHVDRTLLKEEVFNLVVGRHCSDDRPVAIAKLGLINRDVYAFGAVLSHHHRFVGEDHLVKEYDLSFGLEDSTHLDVEISMELGEV